MLRTEEKKIVVYHGTQQGEFCDLRKDPKSFLTCGMIRLPERKNEMLLRCFDASVFTMDPHPPRLGLF